MSALSREHLTHIVCRSRHGRYDVARTSLPLCAFDLAPAALTPAGGMESLAGSFLKGLN